MIPEPLSSVTMWRVLRYYSFVFVADCDLPLEGISSVPTSPSPPSPAWTPWVRTKDPSVAKSARSSLLRPPPLRRSPSEELRHQEEEEKREGVEEGKGEDEEVDSDTESLTDSVDPPQPLDKRRVQFEDKVLVYEIDKCGNCSTKFEDLVTGICPCVYCTSEACDLLPELPPRKPLSSSPVQIGQSAPREELTSQMLDTTPPGSYNPFAESILGDYPSVF